MTTTQIALILQTLLVIGSVVGIYIRIQTDLTSIKARLDFEREAKEDRRAVRRAEVERIVERRIQEHRWDCPAVETTGVHHILPRSKSEV